LNFVLRRFCKLSPWAISRAAAPSLFSLSVHQITSPSLYSERRLSYPTDAVGRRGGAQICCWQLISGDLLPRNARTNTSRQSDSGDARIAKCYATRYDDFNVRSKADK